MINSRVITSEGIVCIDYNGQRHLWTYKCYGVFFKVTLSVGLGIKVTPFLITNVCKTPFL